MKRADRESLIENIGRYSSPIFAKGGSGAKRRHYLISLEPVFTRITGISTLTVLLTDRNDRSRWSSAILRAVRWPENGGRSGSRGERPF
jgi:hypothetical protein